MKKRILCIGDSNTWGYIPGAGGRYEENVRWTGRLASALGPEYVVIEEGMNGRTTVFSDWIEPGVSALEYIYPCLISQFPLDDIVIMLGTNDAKQRYHVSANEIGRGMDQVLLRIEDICRRKGRMPRLLLIAPAPLRPGAGWDDYTAESSEKVRKLSGEYQELAAAHACRFLDAAKIVGEAGLGMDGVHLNEEGHRRLAEAVKKIIFSSSVLK